MNFNINKHILNADDYLNDYEITSSYYYIFFIFLQVNHN